MSLIYFCECSSKQLCARWWLQTSLAQPSELLLVFSRYIFWTSAMVQWLRLYLPVQGLWVQSGLGAKILYDSPAKKTKPKASNIVTPSIKTLKKSLKIIVIHSQFSVTFN